MSVPDPHPLEEILLAIHRAAPRPWHYRAETQRQGFNLQGVEQILELLHLEGLIGRGASSPAEGPGVVLTPRGEEVVRNPEALARLRTDQPINPDEPGSIVRHTLWRPTPPTLTRLIIIANVAVFVWCMYLASQHPGLLSAYLSPSISVPGKVGELVLDPAGSVSAFELLRGQWWRLLTCCFLHGGTLHLLMNMYTLYVCGRFVERTWGRWRYGIIYLVSGWGGSCLAMAWAPLQGVVGASGAICGILAAEGVWVLLNGKYLPRAMAQRGRNQIVTTVVLMVFISLLPGVSGYGHLGGAIAGGIAAVALNVQRFSVGPVRILAWPVLVAIPFASYWHLQDARKTSKGWYVVEEKVFSEDWLRRIRATMRAAIADYSQDVKGIREEKNAERREPEEVKAAIATLQRHIGDLETLAADLEKSGPYYDPVVIEARQNAIDYVRQRAVVYREAQRCLELGKKWKAADERGFDEKWQTMLQLRQQWEQSLE